MGIIADKEEGRSVTSELEATLENKHVVCYIKYFVKLIRCAVTWKYLLAKEDMSLLL